MFIALPSHILRDLGLSHVRGLVLHGAPGTGKSLLSRTVASIMNAGHVSSHLQNVYDIIIRYNYHMV